MKKNYQNTAIGITMFLFILLTAGFASAQRTIQISQDKQFYCTGDTARLTAQAGFNDYTWQKKIVTFVGGTLQINWDACGNERSLLVSEAATFRVRALDGNNFIYSSEISISFFNPLTLRITPGDANNWICEGRSEELTARHGFLAYRWFSMSNGVNPSRIGNGQSIEVTPSDFYTQYWVEADDSRGCTSISDKLSRYRVRCDRYGNRVNNEIKISTDRNKYCDGDTATLTAEFGHDTYKWFFSTDPQGNFIYYGTGREIKVTKTGWYRLDAESPIGLSQQYKEVQFDKLEVEITTTKNPICKGDSAVLEASRGFQQYIWNTSAETSSIKVAPEVDTEYWVVAFDTDGCKAKATIILKVISCDSNDVDNNDSTNTDTTETDSTEMREDSNSMNSSNSNLDANEMSLYPNPTSSGLTLELEESLNYDLTIEIYDQYYGFVMKDVLKSGNTKHTLDLSNLSSGYYYVNLFYSDKTIQRIIEKR